MVRGGSSPLGRTGKAPRTGLLTFCDAIAETPLGVTVLAAPHELAPAALLTVVLWLAGMVTLLAGVVVRMSGNKPIGAALLLVGTLILLFSRPGQSAASVKRVPVVLHGRWTGGRTATELVTFS
jgi:hypothetical protein